MMEGSQLHIHVAKAWKAVSWREGGREGGEGSEEGREGWVREGGEDG